MKNVDPYTFVDPTDSEFRDGSMFAFNESYSYTAYKAWRDDSDVDYSPHPLHEILLPDNITEESGGNVTFNVRLMSQPIDTVFLRVTTKKIVRPTSPPSGYDRYEAVPVRSVAAYRR